MKFFGFKSIGVLLLVFGSMALAIRSDRLDVDHLRALSVSAGFYIGLFTVLAGLWFFHLLHIEKPTRLKSLGKKQTELPRPVMAFFSFIIAFFFGLLCFDSGTVVLMAKIPQRLGNVGARYCPDESEQTKLTTEEPEPGCELIFRAYKLGLIKTLGSCEPKKKEQPLVLCKLRQRDEPLLHYSARQLIDFFDARKTAYEDPKLNEKLQAGFKKQLEYSTALFGKLKHVVKSAPKASHHIFTNLPYPHGTVAYHWAKMFTRNECLSQYRALSQAFNAASGTEGPAASRVFEEVYGKLLFDPKYEAVAGLCDEYTIHWNSDPDSCDKLVHDPKNFLTKAGIANQIQIVLERLREDRDLMGLRLQLHSIYTGEPMPLPPPPSQIAETKKMRAYAMPETIISFQCFMQAGKGEGTRQRTMPFNVYGHTFNAREVRFPEATSPNRVHLTMFKYLSDTMADNFHYTGQINKSTVAVGQQFTVGPQLFERGDYPLTRLEYLKNADIFMNNEWLQDREDLLEVYPYYYHLYHFIEVFRKHYLTQRTRL